MSIVRFDPFYRTAREFDRMAGELIGAARVQSLAYDVVQEGDGRYLVSLAVPGYGEDELEVTAHDRVLTVKGKAKAAETTGYLHRGIAQGEFAKSFSLADHVEVVGASLDKGVLTVALERRVPEALKPRTIAINTPVTTDAKAQQAA